MAESFTWHYYLPSQHGNGDDTIVLRGGNHAHYEISAERAFEDYWDNHDGYELGFDVDYEIVLVAPDGAESHWVVFAGQSVMFDAQQKKT